MIFVQQNAFLSVSSRQNVIFIGPPNPGEPEATVYSSGGQPPAPGAPGAGAAVAPMNIAIPPSLNQPSETYIGTPRKPRRPKQTEPERGRPSLRKQLKRLRFHQL